LPIETRSLPSSLAATHRGFAFCLADPIGSTAGCQLNFLRAERALECGDSMLLLNAATARRKQTSRLTILLS
jgi:hypothetical protein